MLFLYRNCAKGDPYAALMGSREMLTREPEYNWIVELSENELELFQRWLMLLFINPF